MRCGSWKEYSKLLSEHFFSSNTIDWRETPVCRMRTLCRGLMADYAALIRPTSYNDREDVDVFSGDSKLLIHGRWQLSQLEISVSEPEWEQLALPFQRCPWVRFQNSLPRRGLQRLTGFRQPKGIGK
jgi:hypothetical protein